MKLIKVENTIRFLTLHFSAMINITEFNYSSFEHSLRIKLFRCRFESWKQFFEKGKLVNIIIKDIVSVTNFVVFQ